MKKQFVLAVVVLVFLVSKVYALDSTWSAHPVDDQWTTGANWVSGMGPGPLDTAFFATSDGRDIEESYILSVGKYVFMPGADPFTITAGVGIYFDCRLGIENDSGVTQNFVGAADETGGGGFQFIIEENPETITGPVMFTLEPAMSATTGSGYADFILAGAGDATFHNLGANVPGAFGGQTNFYGTGTSAEQATIISEGATVSGATGGVSYFLQGKASAANATLIANPGTNGGGGGGFSFADGSLGGTARLEVFGNGYTDMSNHTGPSLSIGSIEGDGDIYLGKTTFIVGSNDLSTTFSGVLHPGDPTGGHGAGSLTKIGTGTLTLSGANLYTAGTIVNAGTLVVSNTTGSATGTGTVQMNAGTLGGSGIISGAVTVGTGSGTGAFLAPAAGTNTTATFTTQSVLTFNADATYTYSFKAKRNKARTDKVIANGVTINGASFAFQGTAQGTLKRGLTLTAISNTAATPIAGTFSNLPDGAILTVNGNNFQASYEGGDGNDLTLTVVP